MSKNQGGEILTLLERFIDKSVKKIITDQKDRNNNPYESLMSTQEKQLKSSENQLIKFLKTLSLSLQQASTWDETKPYFSYKTLKWILMHKTFTNQNLLLLKIKKVDINKVAFSKESH